MKRMTNMRYIKDNKKFISTIILTLLFIIILNVFKVKSSSFLLLSLLVNIVLIKLFTNGLLI